MAKAKAEFKGSCQICGRAQKLPGGHLSLHGYTKRWGFFNGICPGARYLPFEQSINLIEGRIAVVTEMANELEAKIAVLEAPATELKGWYHVYIPASWQSRHSSYRWQRVEVRERLVKGAGEEYMTTEILAPGRNKDTEQLEWQSAYQLGHYGGAQEVVNKMNGNYARHLGATVKQYREYVKWQEGRIKNWAPSALTPVAA